MGNLRDFVRGERAVGMGSHLGILLEEKALIADLEHKNNAWVPILYARYLSQHLRYKACVDNTNTHLFLQSR